jgi:hypothetical protein
VPVENRHQWCCFSRGRPWASGAAKQLVQAAQEQRSATLQGTIRFSETGVDVSVSAMQTTGTEEIKAKVLEDDNN